MKRIETFSRVIGKDWLNGRYLLPLLKMWGESETGTVLDLGCGQSPFKIYFVNAGQYIRMDRHPTDNEVIQADMQQIPLGGDSTDCVLLFQALSDSAEPELCLKEIHRVLKSGGRLIVYESVCYPEHDLPHDYFRIMPAGMNHLARRAGFAHWETVRLGGGFNRFAMLWNTYLMGRIGLYSILRPVAMIGTMVCNILCYASDRLAPHPNLATDYIARYTKES